MIATPSMPSHKSDKLPRVERNLELLCRMGWDGINVWWTTSLNRDTTILGIKLGKYQISNIKGKIVINHERPKLNSSTHGN